MPQSNVKPIKLPIPVGMEFVSHNAGESGVCDPLCEIGSVAWKWTTKKKRQYGNYWLATDPNIDFWKPHLLNNFWRILGAA